MAIRKTDKASLRSQYPLVMELGLVLSLAVLVMAFRWDVSVHEGVSFLSVDAPLVQLDEIQPTSQPKEPPPPPRPPIPVAVPDDAFLDDAPVLLDSGLGLDGVLLVPHPPAPPSENRRQPDPEVFVIVEQMPELIGGLAALQAHIRYPEIAKKAGVEGRVIVQFVVNERGGVEDPVVVRGIGAGCDEEAIEAVRRARFVPGTQRGKAVKVKMSLPVTFRLR